jgi:transcriptional regulator with XRE-family HTH domain
MVDKKDSSSVLAKRLGRNISSRRKQLAWTQDQLAERVGCDAETISRFERGAHLPSLPTLSRLASTLQIPIGNIMSESDTLIEDDSVLINTWLHGLAPKNRLFVLNIVREYCEHLRGKKL